MPAVLNSANVVVPLAVVVACSVVMLTGSQL